MKDFLKMIFIKIIVSNSGNDFTLPVEMIELM